MAQYNPYGGGGGYGQQNPYSSQSNPYTAGGNPYEGAGRNPYGGQSNGYGQQNVEMQQYNNPPASNNYGGGLPSGPGRGRAGGLPSGPRGGARPPQRGPAPYPTSSRPEGDYGRLPPANNQSNYSNSQSNYSQPSYGDSGYGGSQGYGNPPRPPAPPSPPTAPAGGYSSAGTGNILNDCQAIDQGIAEVESRLNSLQQLHNRVLNDQASPSQIDRENSDIMSTYRELGDRLKKIKSNPASAEPRNAPQVGRVDRRLKKAINDYQRLESDFRKRMQEQQARQFRIVRPDASEDEVRAAVEDPNNSGQIFQQALLNSDRRGQSQSALNAVRARHAEIQRIEQTIIELAQLFQDLDAIVMEQEPLVANIESKAEEVQENVVKANEELDSGIKSARAARKKKWICLFICVLVVIIIGLVAGIYLGIIKPKQNSSSTPAATVTKTAAARLVRRTPDPFVPVSF